MHSYLSKRPFQNGMSHDIKWVRQSLCCALSGYIIEHATFIRTAKDYMLSLDQAFVKALTCIIESNGSKITTLQRPQHRQSYQFSYL